MWKTRTPDYCVAGSSDTTIFILHGIYGGKEYWQPLTQRLVDAGYRVVAWDAPGYGVSPPDPEFSHSRSAEIFARLIASTGTRHNVVFGHSMGGSIGLRVMPLIPGLVDAFIMCASLGYIGNQSPAQLDTFFKLRQVDDSSIETVQQKNLQMVTTMMAPGASGPYVELVKRVGAATPGHAVKASLKAVRDSTEEDALRAFASIRVPSLFIAGELDKTGHPDSIRRNSERVAGSRFEIVAGCGHYPWAEDPDGFWMTLEAFLRRLR